MTDTITIPASGKFEVIVDCRVFTCLSATAEFKLQLGNRTKQLMNAGQSTGGPASQVFHRITFYNLTASVCDVTFYAGLDPYVPQNVVNNTITATATISNSLTGCVEATPAQFLKPSSTPGTPVKLTAAQTYFRKATIKAVKTLDGLSATANAGDVVIGASATASQQPITLAPGDEYTIEAPVGAKYDFRNWYLDVANSGDGVVVIYS